VAWPNRNGLVLFYYSYQPSAVSFQLRLGAPIKKVETNFPKSAHSRVFMARILGTNAHE
jgi:hypothetical protein